MRAGERVASEQADSATAGIVLAGAFLTPRMLGHSTAVVIKQQCGDALRLRVQHNGAIRAGQWWRLLTPTLLHGSLGHLLMNSYSLSVVGPLTERLSGRARFAAVYATSGIAGSIGSFVMLPQMSYGASGVNKAFTCVCYL